MRRFRADEMEVQIALKSARAALVYSALFLFVWTAYNVAKGGDPGLPFILLTSQNVVFFVSQRLLQRRATAGNDEE